MPDSREKLEWKMGVAVAGDVAGIAGLAIGEFTEIGVLIALGGIGGGLALAALPVALIGLGIAVLGPNSSLPDVEKFSEALGFVSVGVLALAPVNAVFPQLSPKDDPLLFAKTFGPVIDATTGILGSKSLEELALASGTFDANEQFWLEDYNKLLNYYYAPSQHGPSPSGVSQPMPGAGPTPSPSPVPTKSWNDDFPGQGDSGLEFPTGGEDEDDSSTRSGETIWLRAGGDPLAEIPESPEFNNGVPENPPFDDGAAENPPFDNGVLENPPEFNNAPPENFNDAPFDNGTFDDGTFDDGP